MVVDTNNDFSTDFELLLDRKNCFHSEVSMGGQRVGTPRGDYVCHYWIAYSEV